MRAKKSSAGSSEVKFLSQAWGRDLSKRLNRYKIVMSPHNTKCPVVMYTMWPVGRGHFVCSVSVSSEYMRLNWKCSTHQWQVLQVCVEGKLGVQGLAWQGGSGAELLHEPQPGPGCCQRAWLCCPEPQRGAEGTHSFLSHLPPAQLNQMRRKGKDCPRESSSPGGCRRAAAT